MDTRAIRAFLALMEEQFGATDDVWAEGLDDSCGRECEVMWTGRPGWAPALVGSDQGLAFARLWNVTLAALHDSSVVIR